MNQQAESLKESYILESLDERGKKKEIGDKRHRNEKSAWGRKDHKVKNRGPAKVSNIEVHP